MLDARLLLLSLERTGRQFISDADRKAFLLENAAKISKCTPQTPNGLLVKTALLAESGSHAAKAVHREALRQYIAAFEAASWVREAETGGYVFELYPRHRTTGWQFSWSRPDRRYRTSDRLFTSVLQGPAREPMRAAILEYLIERATKNGTLPDRHAFDAEHYVREMEEAGGGFQLKPLEKGPGWDFWFIFPDGHASRLAGKGQMLFQMYQIHRAKNRCAITSLLIRREKAAGRWAQYVAWRESMALNASRQAA